MLVLTRRPGERVVINGQITITFIEYHRARGWAKIGIEAPKDVVIDREEIHEAKLRDAETAREEGR